MDQITKLGYEKLIRSNKNVNYNSDSQKPYVVVLRTNFCYDVARSSRKFVKTVFHFIRR